jgi:hypothetical protein
LSQNEDFNVRYNKVHVCHEKISSKSDDKQDSCDDGKAKIVESKPSEVSDLCFEKENDISCCLVDNKGNNKITELRTIL